MRARGGRLAGLAAALALAAAIPAGSDSATTFYVATRGSGYATGDGELLTPRIVLPHGTRLALINLHVWGHSITSDAWRIPHVRLFRSNVIPFGKTAPVEGVESLTRGTYGFFCANHTGMRGSLVIVERAEGRTR